MKAEKFEQGLNVAKEVILRQKSLYMCDWYSACIRAPFNPSFLVKACEAATQRLVMHALRKKGLIISNSTKTTLLMRNLSQKGPHKITSQLILLSSLIAHKGLRTMPQIDPSRTAFLLLLTAPLIVAFDRDSCFAKAKDLRNNFTLPLNSSLFYRDTFDSPPYNGDNNMTLTRSGCNVLCGPQQTWYTDIGPRLSIWLIPVLLLVANVELSPLDKGKFLTILHLLGDPIDSLWSLIHKLDAWDRCAVLATSFTTACPDCQRIIASIFAGYEELQGPRITSEYAFKSLLHGHSILTRFNIWRRTAIRFADARSNQLGRTALALLLYIFQLIAAFVPEVGGAPPGPPGGRIATGVLLSWLVPVIILSNAIGTLSSRRTAYDIMADFATQTEEDEEDRINIVTQRSTFLPSFSLLGKVTDSDYFEALPWAGGIYSYRPWKLRYVTATRHYHSHTLLLACLATAPVIFGLIGGILILWYQLPTGINCRHVWLVSVALLWVLSAIITMVTNRHGFATGLYHWHFTLVKDACVAVPSFLIMFLSAVGLFNSCWCWSGPFQYPDTGRVPMPETVYLRNAKSVYPAIVGLTLLSEVVIVATVMILWRRGLRLLRFTETERKREWDHIANNTECECIINWVENRQMSVSSEGSLLKSGASVGAAFA
jgi:hypothetical protein